jgi:hypothetical protein
VVEYALYTYRVENALVGGEKLPERLLDRSE